MLQALSIILYPLVNSNWSYSLETPNFFSHVTVKFEGWPWKTIGHLFFTILSFVHHFKSMSELNLELQSGTAQFRSKSAIFWPLQLWNLTDDLEANLRDLIAAPGLLTLLKFDPDHRFFSPCDLEIWWMTLNKANLRDLIAATGLVILLKFDPNHRFFSQCDLEIWCMTSKNNRAPLLYYIKLCVSFQIHRWIQTEVTLRKRSIRVVIGDFLSLVTLKFDGWPWKTIGHLFYTTSSFVHHFKSIGELKLKLQSRNAQFGSKSAMFCPVWPWNLTDALEKQ